MNFVLMKIIAYEIFSNYGILATHLHIRKKPKY